MKILFVAFPHSIHTVRWISQLKNAGWEVSFTPSVNTPIFHEALPDVAALFSPMYVLSSPFKAIRRHGVWFLVLNIILSLATFLLALFYSDFKRRVAHRYLSARLRLLIWLKHPDIIHSLETQSAGYLVSSLKKQCKGRFPIWIHTNWGSDLYLFGRLADHQHRINDVISQVDFFVPESRREIDLVRAFGFAGKVLPIIHPAGGFDLDIMRSLRTQTKTSFRKNIMLKGYQGWAGRALVALRALELCADVLHDFTVLLCSARTEDVLIKAELFSLSTGVKVQVIPLGTPHDDILMYHASSRISIGLSISDGVPSSLLEAMLTGSFPIQSSNSVADEWIVDGETGFIVPPEDPENVAVAIRRALTDDALVDRAAELNWERNIERLDQKILAEKTIQLYTDILETGKAERNDVQ